MCLTSHLVLLTSGQAAIPDTEEAVLVSGEHDVPFAEDLEDADLVCGVDVLEDSFVLQVPDEKIVDSCVLVSSAESGQAFSAREQLKRKLTSPSPGQIKSPPILYLSSQRLARKAFDGSIYARIFSGIQW